jgi:hypothetical protein
LPQIQSEGSPNDILRLCLCSTQSFVEQMLLADKFLPLFSAASVPLQLTML